MIYCGCEVTQDANYRATVKQERFSEGIHEINIPKDRQREASEEVTPLEKSEMRNLNWRATQSAPWLLATINHVQGCSENAGVSDLLETNKLIRLQGRYSDRALSLKAVWRNL